MQTDVLKRIRRLADRGIHHWITEVVLLVLILVSVAMLLAELLLPPGPGIRVLEIAGEVITGVFIVELLVRFWVARKKSRFFARYWIDILAVIPLIRPLRFFRVLRVLRLFRVGVLLNRRVSAFHGAFLGTTSEILALLVGSAVLVISAAMVLFYFEHGVDADFADFQDALWFAAYSLVAGEPTGGLPDTEVGRWTTLMLMLGGLTLFGMFVGTVSAGMVARLSRNLEVTEMDLDELTGHVVLCGWNRSAPEVLRELFGVGTPADRAVVLVTESRPPHEDIPVDGGIRREHLYFVEGDYTRVDVLERIGVRQAATLILLADDMSPRSPQDQDARTVLAALTIERMVPGIYTVAELHSRQNEELLRMAGVEEIVIGDWYAGTIIGSVSRNQGLVAVLDEILTGEHGSSFHSAVVPQAWAGRTVAELHAELFVRHKAILVSVEQQDGDGRVMVVNPDPETTLSTGQRIMLLSRRRVRL